MEYYDQKRNIYTRTHTLKHKTTHALSNTKRTRIGAHTHAHARTHTHTHAHNTDAHTHARAHTHAHTHL